MNLNIESFDFSYSSWGPGNITIYIKDYYPDWKRLSSNNIFIQYNGGTAGTAGGSCNATGTYDATTSAFTFYFGINNKQNTFTAYIITIK